MNLIKNMFLWWKQLVRGSNPSNEMKSIEIIDEIFNQISNLNCLGHSKQMLSNLRKCVWKETILEN